MSFSYQNINDILSSSGPIRGARYAVNKERRIIVPTLYTVDDPINLVEKDSLELHIYHRNTAYVGSVYDIKSWTVDNLLDPNAIYMDVINDIKPFNLQNGSYRIVYNFLRNTVSSRTSDTKLFIAEISRNRQELVLALTNPNDGSAQSRLTDFVLEYMSPKKYLPNIVLNFGQNILIDVINVTSDGNLNYFYVKLFSRLPNNLDVRSECWLQSQILKPYIDQLELSDVPPPETVNPNQLRGPNYSVENTYNLTSDTEFKSWNDLLSENVNTSQEILNKYIFGDNKPVTLNIDYTKFESFVFYSSATERVENFFYKIQLLERYKQQLDDLVGFVGDTEQIETNILTITNLRDKVISGFDEWEKWLYTEEYTTTVGQINPFPKFSVFDLEDISVKSGKYRLYKTTDVIVKDWYDGLIALATDYDRQNKNSLYSVLPEHVKSDAQNEQFNTFVNMIGHHFDVVYTYINHILKKNIRDENPKNELSQDLVQAVTNNFGWKLSSNIQEKDLWEYALGLNAENDSATNLLGKKYNKTEEERTKEVWRRILNNLPYIQKTKGTSRGIKALLAAYGIPQTLISIREYGGPYNPNSLELGKNVYEKATYFLNFNRTPNQYIETPWERVNHKDDWVYPDTITFRWRMNPEKVYSYDGIENQTLLQKQSGSLVNWFVTVNKNGTDIERGGIYFYLGDGNTYLSASIEDEFLFDDVPLNIMIRRNITNDNPTVNQRYDLILKSEKYGKLAIEKSASIFVTGSVNPEYNESWASDGKVYVGYGSNNQTSNGIFGSVFELRYWSDQLREDSFNNHVLAARAYNGNDPSSSFYDLKAQWKFWQPLDLGTIKTIKSSHPNQKQNTFYSSSKVANLNGFTRDSFESATEVYNMDTANLGANTDYSQKVRIDSASLAGALNMNTSYEESALLMNSVDSNRLMVAFSPQHIINEDIYEAIGDTDLSEFIGDFGIIDSDEYRELNRFSEEYWKKYSNKNDFNAYISIVSQFDLSVFEQIAQTLPARVNEILGLVIEPNVLERSKVVSNKGTTAETKDFYSETEVIDWFPDTPADYNSKNTVLFVGFEDGDALEISMYDGQNDAVTNIESETDERIKMGEIEVSPKNVAKINNKTANLKIDRINKPNFQYKSYGTLIKTDLTKADLNAKSTMYHAILPTAKGNPIDSKMIVFDNFPSLTSSFNRNDNKSFIDYTYYNQISEYETYDYYDTVIKYANPKQADQIIVELKDSSNYKSPNYFETAKRNREFIGCNDYPYPYKKSKNMGLSFLNANSEALNYKLIYENYEDTSYQYNDYETLKFNDIFPSSSFWKTEIRGDFFDNTNKPKNIYGLEHTAPRIIKLDTSSSYSKGRNLFTPKFLQEGKESGTNRYVNYPSSQQYIRSFPWVMWWSGSNNSVPNLGPDLGFTSAQSLISEVRSVTDPRNPQIQK
jgi:hypothetical protein